MQSLPDNFVPPANWGKYPSFGGNQTSVINMAYPKPPTEDGPGFADNGFSNVNVQGPKNPNYKNPQTFPLP